ncbi:tail fiber domain-containing protein [Profundibacter sp.]
MRRMLITGAMIVSLTATSTFAGNLVEPAMEPEIVAAETTSSGGAMVVPILLIVLMAAAIASGGSDTAPPPPPLIPSDSRLKTDIVQVGTAANGLPLYQFRYKALPTVFQGVMAQDVLTHTPEAVVTMPGGYYAVKYDMLGLEMTIVY